MKFIPYLSFEGNAEDAIKFYADALGGEVRGIMRWKDAPPDGGMPPIPDDYMEKIMHGSLTVNSELLFFSDTFPGMNVTKGNIVEINIDFDTEEELRAAFDKLLVDGTVNMPVDKMFWGSIFGSLTDKFGIGWSVNYDIPQE